MYAKITSFGVNVLDGYMVSVEADISGGLPKFEIVGLPDNAVKEAKERVRSALKNLRFTYPPSRITINLAPASLRKTGPVYDLPMLISILCASEQLPTPSPSIAFIGELALDGSVRPVTGVLPMALAAENAGVQELFVPFENAAEASVAPGLTVYPVKTARDVFLHLTGEQKVAPAPPFTAVHTTTHSLLDFSDVKGQPEARRALEIAAAGGHNALLIGPPGTGKSMLAKRIPSILPPLTQAESIDTTKIYSVAGELPSGTSLLQERPFRSPHHTVSSAGLSGGGAFPRPGEISLAHNGVLFLDEFPEFSREALEILRQPLEDGKVTLSRVAGNATYPCNIMLITAMNPCPCGYLGHPVKQCTCTQYAIDKYRQRVSGPLLDRIDIHQEVLPVEYDDLSSVDKGESSADIFERVEKARAIQALRQKQTGVLLNAQIPSGVLRDVCQITPNADALLKKAFDKLGLSARAHDKILRVSRTIADLSASARVDVPHVAEAVQYRSLDRKYWYAK
jgi:Mg chelatase-related protein